MKSYSVISKPPGKLNILNGICVFLAGSIEMGKAEDWQARVQKELENYPVDIYNPRRDDWDSSWIQDINNTKFFEQVTWELNALEKADVIAMYFALETVSPISLLELGFHLGRNPHKLVVFCPKGFQRKGNVDITCQRYGVKVHDNFDNWIFNMKDKLGLI